MISKVKKIFNPNSVRRLVNYVSENGLKGVGEKIKKGMGEGTVLSDIYPEWFLSTRVSNDELEKQREAHFDYEPLISILVPTYNTPEKFLEEMIESCISQSYKNWELCIADASTDYGTRNVLKAYMAKDARIKITWLRDNLGISDNTNEALKLAKGEYIGLLDHDDVIEPDLFYQLVLMLQDTDYEFIYTDEDKIIGKGDKWRYAEPHFKPDISIDLLRSHNYITHFVLVKSDVMSEIGGLHKEFDGSQDYDLILRAYDIVTKKGKKIGHVPRVLYHWRVHEGSTAKNPENKMYCYESGRNAIMAELERNDIRAYVDTSELWGIYNVKYRSKCNPLLSIVIPVRKEESQVDTCIQTIIDKSDYKNTEFIIVLPKIASEKLVKKLVSLKSKYKNVYIARSIRNNYSAMVNLAVASAKGEYALLLNENVSMIKPDTISNMASMLEREEVCAVGAKLLTHEDRIYHAGIILGARERIVEVHEGLKDDEYGYMERAILNGNYSAYSSECLMLKKKDYQRVLGFDESLSEGAGMVDFGLKLTKEGRLITYAAGLKWYIARDKSERIISEEEKELLISRWSEVFEKGDPYYNQSFSRNQKPFMVEIDTNNEVKE